VYQEHLRIIDAFAADLDTAQKQVRDLERDNAELTAKLTALHRRQFKANKKPATEGIKVIGKPSVEDAGKKRRGAPIGHPGWFRRGACHFRPTICPLRPIT
jgi:hypothetical protein